MPFSSFKIKPRLYHPQGLLLPPEVKRQPQVQLQLLNYMSLLRVAGSAPLRPAWDLPTSSAAQLRYLSAKEKLQLLAEPLPLYFDLFIQQGLLIGIGPGLAELDKLLGPVQLLLKRVAASPSTGQQLNYYSQIFNPRLCRGERMIYSNALKYLIVSDLPAEVLAQPQEWCLEFNYPTFSQEVRLQANPFVSMTKGQAVPPAKSTLITMQRDNPSEWLEQWCDYYYRQHKIKRIVIYDNLSTQSFNPLTEPEDPAAEELELWSVAWNYSYQCYFTQCQLGGLQHAAWWLYKQASYLLNFDVDEYLLNQSELSLDDFITQLAPYGAGLGGCEVNAPYDPEFKLAKKELAVRGCYKSGVVTAGTPATIDLPQVGARYKRDGGSAGATGTNSAKYLFVPGYWHVLSAHCAECKNFFPAPAFWYLLQQGKRGLKFWLSRLLYWPSLRGFYAWQGVKRRLGLMELPTALTQQRQVDDELCFLHYKQLNTNWKFHKTNNRLNKVPAK